MTLLLQACSCLPLVQAAYVTEKIVSIDQYHCHTNCLGNMTSSHMRSFMEKKWREPFVAKVVTELHKVFKEKPYIYSDTC